MASTRFPKRRLKGWADNLPDSAFGGQKAQVQQRSLVGAARRLQKKVRHPGPRQNSGFTDLPRQDNVTLNWKRFSR